MKTGSGRSLETTGYQTHTKCVFLGTLGDGKIRDFEVDDPQCRETFFAPHASVLVLYRIFENSLQVLSFQIRESGRDYCPWVLPAETAEGDETPYATAQACIDHEVAERPRSLNFALVSEPIFQIERFASLTRKKEYVQWLGKLEWVEIDALYRRMRQRGKPFHLLALYKALDYLALRVPGIADRYAALLGEMENYLESANILEH